MSIKCIVVAEASKGYNETVRTADGGGSVAPPIIRFSVEGSNRASPRSSDRGASGAPITMDKCERVKKHIDVEYKGGSDNIMLRTAGGVGRKSASTMRFSVKYSNGASLRRAHGGAIGALRTMNKWGVGNEGDNGATLPRRYPVINHYTKQSRLGRVRNCGVDRVHGGSRKGRKSRGHGRKTKGSGAKFNIKKNGPRETICGSLMHAFRIYGIGSDVGIDECE